MSKASAAFLARTIIAQGLAERGGSAISPDVTETTGHGGYHVEGGEWAIRTPLGTAIVKLPSDQSEAFPLLSAHIWFRPEPPNAWLKRYPDPIHVTAEGSSSSDAKKVARETLAFLDRIRGEGARKENPVPLDTVSMENLQEALKLASEWGEIADDSTVDLLLQRVHPALRGDFAELRDAWEERGRAYDLPEQHEADPAADPERFDRVQEALEEKLRAEMRRRDPGCC